MATTLTPLPAIEAVHRKARILIVDDARGNLVTMEAILAPLGQELVFAASGDEALKHLLHQDFAVILMDVQMPGLDGLETSRLVRSRERTRHIPIIFVTALSREAAYVTRGYAEGGVDYLLKPIDPDILRAKVSVFVELFLRGERVKDQAAEIAARVRGEEELRRVAGLGEQLVAIVGHDIRSPLSAILMSAQRRLAAEGVDEESRRAFGRIERGTLRISRMVEVLLDFTRARIGVGIPVTLTASDLSGMVRHAVDEARAAAPEREIIAVLPESPVTGEWDLERLSQVLANLLTNALKHGARDGKVRVELSAPAPDHALLRVHNDGPPIAAAALPDLFEPFKRGIPTEHSDVEGLGLGLFIAREIVRAHGGAISVHSTAAEGTTFEVCLPTVRVRDRVTPPPCADGAVASA